MLGGRLLEFESDGPSCRFEWHIGTEFCHSVDVVQGGFITAMLDATMSHACFGLADDIVTVATLEIKVSFLEPSRAGRFETIGRILKSSHKTAFLSAELFDADEALTATATSTAKLVRAR